MQFLVSRLTREFPDWNRRELTELDCWRYVERKRIRVHRYPFKAKGYYGRTEFRKRVRYYIVLDENLRGLEFLQVFLHEIGHAVLHEPFGNREVLQFRSECTIENSQDYQAHIVSVIGMIPRWRLFSLTATPFDEISAPLAALCEQRLKIFRRHGL